MTLPDISNLTLDERAPPPLLPDDIGDEGDPDMVKLKNYAKSLPYAIESNSRMQELLDFILLRISQCVEAKDYDPGLLQWDSMFTLCAPFTPEDVAHSDAFPLYEVG